ncbi:hypothetical protein [Mucilaginibacter sp.]
MLRREVDVLSVSFKRASGLAGARVTGAPFMSVLPLVVQVV